MNVECADRQAQERQQEHSQDGCDLAHGPDGIWHAILVTLQCTQRRAACKPGFCRVFFPTYNGR